MERTVAETKAKRVYYWGVGRRKTAVASVRIFEGSGKILVNGKPLEKYFSEEKDKRFILGPLELADITKGVDVIAKVEGGGISGQAGAVSQGLARALKNMFGLKTVEEVEGTPPVTLAKKLRDSGFLTRDGRMKERKKYGRKGARKSFQFSKR
ncbi:MAG: 30S ribosomal protein S9 [Gemmataceae bacterium]|nr:30S ribosomal protein S9 [Gemmataceae bacterium]